MSRPITPAVEAYSTHLLLKGFTRPHLRSNAWVGSPEDDPPTLTFTWHKPQRTRKLMLYFDTDFDHPLEGSLMGHPEHQMPFGVKEYKILDEQGKLLHHEQHNHQSINVIHFSDTLTSRKLQLELKVPSAQMPAALFYIQCFQDDAT